MPLPVYIVALQDSTRVAPLLDTLSDAGILPLRIDAVDGRRGLPPAYEPNVDRARAARNLGRAMSDPEIACALSHQALYARIAGDGGAGAVVLEEDAILTPDFFRWHAATEELPADLVLLDHRRTYVWPWPEPADLVPGVRAHRALVPPFLTTGYAITPRGARHILEASRPLAAPADWPCDILPLRPLVAVPPIVSHPDKSGSTLESTRSRDKRPRLERFASLSYWRRWLGKRIGRRVA